MGANSVTPMPNAPIANERRPRLSFMVAPSDQCRGKAGKTLLLTIGGMGVGRQ